MSQFALQILPTQGSASLVATVDVFPGFEPIVILDSSVSEVPEPGTALLVLFAIPAGLILKRRLA